MDSTIPTPTVGSTVSSSTASSDSTQTPSSPPVLFLEVSLISAQDLTPVSKSMRTYAVAWISPNQKLTTRTDQQHTHPTWNDKLTFRVDGELLFSPKAALNVEIYTISWLRHVLVGTVRVLISDLLAPLKNHPKKTRFVALQVRRPSGTPRGILNMGVAVLDNSLKSVLLKHQIDSPLDKNSGDEVGNKGDEKNENQECQKELDNKIHLWRSMSIGSEMNNDDFPLKAGSVCNGSMVNGSVCNGSVVTGSELCSDIGPSASIVAGELARKMQPPPLAKRSFRKKQADDTGSSILEELTFEEAIAKGYRTRTTRENWRRTMYDCDESEVSYMRSRQSRRHSDGNLFSCFVAGVEFTIVCGSGNKQSSNKYSNSMSRRKNKLPSDTNSD